MRVCLKPFRSLSRHLYGLSLPAHRFVPRGGVQRTLRPLGQASTCHLELHHYQSKFSISSGGVLTFNSAPNFEAPTDANGDNVYVVTVHASNGAGGTAMQTINVTVTGVNEPPIFTSPNTANVAENSTAVMTVTAIDPDSPARERRAQQRQGYPRIGRLLDVDGDGRQR